MLALCGAAAACSEAPPPAREPGDLVLAGVTVVDVRTGALAPDRAIVIEDGRIAEIVAAGAVPAQAGVPVVDGGGRFVVPGYLDLHAHPLQSDPQRNLAMMLATGVTGYRQMAGTPDLLERRRSGTLRFAIETPELLAMPGLPLVSLIAPSPDAAIAEVREQRELGADFVKVASLPPDAFFAALGEAERLGLPFAGHLSYTVTPQDAAKAGMRAIEHLGPSIALLLACSADEAAIRETIAGLPAPDLRSPLPPGLIKRALPFLEGMLERFVANPTLQTDAAQLALIRRVVETYDDAKCRALAAELARAEVWQVPTLIRIRTMLLGGEASWAADPGLRFVPAETESLWLELGAEFRAKFTAADREVLAALFALQLRFVKVLHEAGVPMLAGSDACGAQWIVPGLGLHRELDLLAEAGLAPLEILQMATLDGAVFLGREATMGTVAPGKDADLVLLERSPLESVANLHAVDGVVRDGRYYPRSALEDWQSALARPRPAP